MKAVRMSKSGRQLLDRGDANHNSGGSGALTTKANQKLGLNVEYLAVEVSYFA